MVLPLQGKITAKNNPGSFHPRHQCSTNCLALCATLHPKFTLLKQSPNLENFLSVQLFINQAVNEHGCSVQWDASLLQGAGLHSHNSIRIFAFQSSGFHSGLLADHFQKQACMFQSWDPYAVMSIHPRVLYNIFGPGNGNNKQIHRTPDSYSSSWSRAQMFT